MATAKQLDEITECSICTEVYTDPRVLPCVHTYCLKCIREWSRDKQPGDKLACPLCRKEFTLSSNGVDDLPKNFFVTNFLQMKELSSGEGETGPCEACRGDEESEVGLQNVASVYCIECQMKLCKSCERVHKAIKVTSSHKLVEIGDKLSLETLRQALPPSCCDQHKDEYLKIYCVDCKVAICMMCYIKSHNGHTCLEVNEVVEGFREQMISDVNSIAAGVDRCRAMLESVEKEKSEFVEQVEKAGVEVSEKAEQLKRMIDDHRDKHMNELSLKKQKRMKEIESLREEIERQLLSMESYTKYVDEVRQKGTACDIARAASGLHDRGEELLKFDAIENTMDNLGHADVKFVSSDVIVDSASKTLGEVRLNVVKSASSITELTHVIRPPPQCSNPGVAAITSLGDDVFVLRQGSQQVEVYDARTFALQRHIRIPALGSSSCGLAASIHNDCLYASDGSNWRIHRVDLSDSSAVKQWSVASCPAGLSVNNDHNVVVAYSTVRKLQEYTTHGTLVREISLQQAGVYIPWHAVQLSTGDYVVSQYTSPGAVSVVGVDGQVVRSYDQSQASNVGPMSNPASLAVTKNDNILVADCRNNRILSLNSSLSSAYELVLPVDNAIQGLFGLFLDELRKRLYVGEFGGECRVLVFDNMQL